jgi:hypothetical protein
LDFENNAGIVTHSQSSLFSCSSGLYFALKSFLSGTVAMDTNQGGAAINLVDDRYSTLFLLHKDDT